MTKFDEAVNSILAKEISKRKKKIRKQLSKFKIRKRNIPQTMQPSPALKTGLPSSEIANSPTPPQVMP